jgi:deoxyhypusine synthase
MKICQISDIHIKNFKYHKQYEEVFENLYKKIKEVKPDITLMEIRREIAQELGIHLFQ